MRLFFITTAMTIEDVINYVCERNGFIYDDLLEYDKSYNKATTRYMLWFYLHVEMKVSIGVLSKMFNRNRPSIFRGIRILRHDMKLYKDTADRYIALKTELEAISEETASNNDMDIID